MTRVLEACEGVAGAAEALAHAARCSLDALRLARPRLFLLSDDHLLPLLALPPPPPPAPPALPASGASPAGGASPHPFSPHPTNGASGAGGASGGHGFQIPANVGAALLERFALSRLFPNMRSLHADANSVRPS